MQRRWYCLRASLVVHCGTMRYHAVPQALQRWPLKPRPSRRRFTRSYPSAPTVYSWHPGTTRTPRHVGASPYPGTTGQGMLNAPRDTLGHCTSQVMRNEGALSARPYCGPRERHGMRCAAVSAYPYTTMRTTMVLYYLCTYRHHTSTPLPTAVIARVPTRPFLSVVHHRLPPSHALRSARAVPAMPTGAITLSASKRMHPS